jgi:hypothetical protein
VICILQIFIVCDNEDCIKIPMVYYDNIGRNQQTSKKVSQSEIQDVIVKLNDRRKQKINYKMPAKLMAEHRVAIFSHKKWD